MCRNLTISLHCWLSSDERTSNLYKYCSSNLQTFLLAYQTTQDKLKNGRAVCVVLLLANPVSH